MSHSEDDISSIHNWLISCISCYNNENLRHKDIIIFRYDIATLGWANNQQMTKFGNWSEQKACTALVLNLLTNTNITLYKVVEILPNSAHLGFSAKLKIWQVSACKMIKKTA